MWNMQFSEVIHLRKRSFNLAEDGHVSVSEGIAEVLGRQQAQRQAVHTEAFRVQQWVRERTHLSPVDIQHARA